MDVTLSADQELLQKSAREFLEKSCDTGVVRAALEHDEFRADLWEEISRLGWTGLAFPEDAGGQGLGSTEQVLLAEAMGRTLLPLPYFSSTVLAGEVLRDTEWLPRVGSGELIASLVLPEPWLARAGTVSAEPTTTGFRLRGSVLSVPDAHRAAALVVVADGSIFVVDRPGPGVEVDPQPTLDGTRRLCAVRLDLEVPDDRRVADADPAVERALDRARVFLAAEAVGGAERCLEMAVDYAKSREQFGRAIGSFQGVSHPLVDVLLATESARSLVYWAAWAQDADPERASLAASAARVGACDAFRRAAEEAIQTLGGIGFTWEHDLHLYLRRALWDAAFPQDLIDERDRVAGLLPTAT